MAFAAALRWMKENVDCDNIDQLIAWKASLKIRSDSTESEFDQKLPLRSKNSFNWNKLTDSTQSSIFYSSVFLQHTLSVRSKTWFLDLWLKLGILKRCRIWDGFRSSSLDIPKICRACNRLGQADQSFNTPPKSLCPGPIWPLDTKKLIWKTRNHFQFSLEILLFADFQAKSQLYTIKQDSSFNLVFHWNYSSI